MPYRDRRLPRPQRLAALLEAAGGRGTMRRLGRWLDEEGEELRPLLLEEGRRRGADLPDDAILWPGKRLLRKARGAEAPARERTNPIRLDEGFTCAACGMEVPPGGRRVRDHCPRCLRSLHVDLVPGDRAESCHGLMDPVGAQVGGRAEVVIRYRCRRCGREHQNRAMMDGAEPDMPESLRLLSAGEEPWPPAALAPQPPPQEMEE